MKDKIKEFREKHPWLDAIAGFIPYVGEAQDIHDFAHAAKKQDIAGMSWALLGLAIPGLAGGQLKKLAKFGDDVISGGISTSRSLLDRIASGSISKTALTKEGLSQTQADKLIKYSKERFLTDSQKFEMNELLVKYMKKAKGKKGSNITITKAQQMDEDLVKKNKRIYDNIMKSKTAQKLQEIAEKTEKDYGAPVKWNWFDQGILAKENIPVQVAVGKAMINGVEDTQPIMLRFLNNMASKTIQNTFKELVDKGYLKAINGQWVTPTKTGTFLVVDPTRYTLNFMMSKMGGNTNRINYVLRRASHGGKTTNIPWHGTTYGDQNLFTRYDNATTRPLFTSIDNGKEGFQNVKNAYGRPTKIPVMRKIEKYEQEEPWEARLGASHGSNSYDNKGELMTWFETHPGKSQEVIDVSDVADIPGNTGKAQDEYIFGINTPDVKFLLNTFNFNGEKGAFTLKFGGKLLNMINGKNNNKHWCR